MTNLRMKLPPLTSMAAFEAVCRHSSFTRAASELCLTQAAVSRQIIALEKNLGVVLFERRSHSVALTDDGRWYANAINPAINAIAESTFKLKSRHWNELTLFTEPCLANYWLMPRISRYQALFPEVTVNLLTSNLDIDSAKDSFDIGMQYGFANNKVFSQQAKWKDEIVVVTSTEIYDKLPANPQLTDLLNFPLVHVNRTGPGWMSWADFFNHHGGQLPDNHTSLQFNNYHSVVDATIHGAGICLGWIAVLQSVMQEQKLLQVGQFNMPSPDDLFIYTKRNSPNSAAAMKFIDWAKQEA